MKMKSEFWMKEAESAGKDADVLGQDGSEHTACQLAELRRVICLMIAQALKEEEE